MTSTYGLLEIIYYNGQQRKSLRTNHYGQLKSLAPLTRSHDSFLVDIWTYMVCYF
jgi:hypothetical protein